MTKLFNNKLAACALLGILVFGAVLSLPSADAGWSYGINFDKYRYLPGDQATASIHIENENEGQLNIYSAGIHFDWMASGEKYVSNSQPYPYTLADGMMHNFNITFDVPMGVEIRDHQFDIILSYNRTSTYPPNQIETTTYTWGTPLQIVDYAITIAPSTAIQIMPGETATYEITVAPQNWFFGSVNFEVDPQASGFPDGVNVSFSPESAWDSTTMTITTTNGTETGSFSITVYGKFDGNVRTAICKIQIGSSTGTKGTPGFEMLPLLGAIGLLAFSNRKKK